MKDYPRDVVSLDQSVFERSNGQLVGHPVVHAPADNSAGEYIQNNSQIQPSFGSSDVRNVASRRQSRAGLGLRLRSYVEPNSAQSVAYAPSLLLL